MNPRRRRVARQRRKRRDLHLEIDAVADRLLADLDAMVRPTWQSIELKPGDAGDTIEVVPLAYAPHVSCKVKVTGEPTAGAFEGDGSPLDREGVAELARALKSTPVRFVPVQAAAKPPSWKGRK